MHIFFHATSSRKMSSIQNIAILLLFSSHFPCGALTMWLVLFVVNVIANLHFHASIPGVVVILVVVVLVAAAVVSHFFLFFSLFLA